MKGFCWFEKFVSTLTYLRICSGLDHPNLVKFFGITTSPKLRILMEFVPKGDLRHSFHFKTDESKKEEQDLKKKRKELKCGNRSHQEFEDLEKKFFENQLALDKGHFSWNLRLKITLDIARGMKYLHSFVPPIMHRDLRSPNIFLVDLNESAPINAKVSILFIFGIKICV